MLRPRAELKKEASSTADTRMQEQDRSSYWAECSEVGLQNVFDQTRSRLDIDAAVTFMSLVRRVAASQVRRGRAGLSLETLVMLCKDGGVC